MKPINSTTVRADGIRYIKLRNDGPKDKRWQQYSRWLWETLRGPVPADKRVLHKDGNLSNDHIDNLVLGTISDVAWIHCHSDPKKSADSYRKCRKATAASNRLRGQVNRMLNWLPTRWYAVNLQKKRAWNNPKKNVAQVARELGLLDSRGPRYVWPSLLGYPGGNRAEAIVVRCLTDQLQRTAELLAAVREFSELLGFTPMKVSTLRSALSQLRKRGHIAGPRGAFRLTIPPPPPLAVLRGKHIMKKFTTMARCDSISDLLL